MNDRIAVSIGVVVVTRDADKEEERVVWELNDVFIVIASGVGFGVFERRVEAKVHIKRTAKHVQHNRIYSCRGNRQCCSSRW